jgi:hypothetical protein
VWQSWGGGGMRARQDNHRADLNGPVAVLERRLGWVRKNMDGPAGGPWDKVMSARPADADRSWRSATPIAGRTWLSKGWGAGFNARERCRGCGYKGGVREG